MTAPFLKWAGGKRWLTGTNALPVPTAFERYVEPFLGGGAVFFALKPAKALLSDVNRDLIRLYRVIRDQPAQFTELMHAHHEQHSKTYYYKMRDLKPSSSLEKAAKFLYLNRACWNGLYRVNLKGEFNVPIGTKTSIVFDSDDFFAVAKLLLKAKLRCADFEPIIDACVPGDFLFVDPPYTVKHNFNNFLKYNEKIFSWDDQVRLRDSVIRAVERGVAVAVTNADHASIRDLYRDVTAYTKLRRHSVLAGNADKRVATTEALFTANVA